MDKMEKSVQKIIGFKKTSSRYVYKKLPLVGYTEEDCESDFFEIISEEDFKSITDKSIMGIQRIKLHKFKDLTLE